MIKQLHTTCCIVGGGPAGVMLGFLLARAGIDAIVLEKHEDFFRDFRGDTIHPSTLQVMHELDVLDEFLRRPHDETRRLHVNVGNESATVADFSHLPTKCKFVAFMPQWDFLNFLAEKGKAYPSLKLLMKAEARDLIEENGRVVGVRASVLEGDVEIRAKLTVGADGRHSIMREKAGLEIMNIGAPMDVLWMRISRRHTDPGDTLGHIGIGKMFVMIKRDTYWQCAYVIPKGEIDRIKAAGLEAFRKNLIELAPFLLDRTDEIKDWEDVKLLTVVVDRLKEWFRPGLLCIGDAAHAMSPVGGVGINLAIQDAIAAANILATPLRNDAAGLNSLRAVQKRREWPTHMTQKLQVLIQDKIITRVLESQRQLHMPLIMKMLNRFSILQRIPARIVGMGFRPEHIRTPKG